MEKWQLGRRLQNSFPEKENHVGTAGSGSYPRRDREAGDQGREEDWASVKVGAIRTRKEPPKMGFKNNHSPNFNRKPKISHRSIMP